MQYNIAIQAYNQLLSIKEAAPDLKLDKILGYLSLFLNAIDAKQHKNRLLPQDSPLPLFIIKIVQLALIKMNNLSEYPPHQITQAKNSEKVEENNLCQNLSLIKETQDFYNNLKKGYPDIKNISLEEIFTQNTAYYKLQLDRYFLKLDEIKSYYNNECYTEPTDNEKSFYIPSKNSAHLKITPSTETNHLIVKNDKSSLFPALDNWLREKQTYIPSQSNNKIMELIDGYGPVDAICAEKTTDALGYLSVKPWKNTMR